MNRFQYWAGPLIFLSTLLGVFGIGRNFLVAKDAIAFWSIVLSLFMIWLTSKTVGRGFITEAAARVERSPAWFDLSNTQRCYLMWFDWPVFETLREREVKRLFRHALIAINFDDDTISLQPVDAVYIRPYFLIRIASAASGFGLSVSNLSQGVFGAKIQGSRIILKTLENDQRIMKRLRSEIGNQLSISLEHFIAKLESAYADTLSPEDRHQYFRQKYA